MVDPTPIIDYDAVGDDPGDMPAEPVYNGPRPLPTEAEMFPDLTDDDDDRPSFNKTEFLVIGLLVVVVIIAIIAIFAA